MAKNEKSQTKNTGLENVENPLSRTEAFIEHNQKYFIYGVSALVVVILLAIGYVRFIRTPHIEESWNEAYKAEFYFEQDSFRLALYGDGFYPGFLEIIDNYGRTPIGNASRYYAGVCFMRLGDYNEAIRQLKRFKSDDPMVGAMALGVVGDAKVELGQLNEALNYYLKAVDHASNDFLSPAYLMKAAAIAEEIGDFNQALSLYKRIETEYFGTSEQNNVGKYIKRAKILKNK